MCQVKTREALESARVGFGITRSEAAEKLGVTDEWIRQIEKGVTSGIATNKSIIKLCKWYRCLALEEGYDDSQFHQAVLCPADFPATMSSKTDTEDSE